jgi:nicotinic acid mononucleotide adenylyltransferase
MLELLIADLPFEQERRVKIMAIEHTEKLSGKTIETLDRLIQEYPTRQFRLVMGADSFATFDRWYEWESILSVVPVSVIPRAELFTNEEVLSSCSQSLQSYVGDKVILHTVPNAEERWFSSTQTKEDLELLGKSIQVSPTILSYIRANKLYDIM